MMLTVITGCAEQLRVSNMLLPALNGGFKRCNLSQVTSNRVMVIGDGERVCVYFGKGGIKKEKKRKAHWRLVTLTDSVQKRL